MTEPRPRPKGAPIVSLSLAAFLILFAVLAVRLSRGEDPALGTGKAAPVEPRRVLVRRIVMRRVVVHVIPPPEITQSAPGGTPAGAVVATAGPAPASSAATAPAPARAATPVASAPAPAVAAAPAPPPPAPAPAPVTRSS